MAKRKITVTVDEEHVDRMKRLHGESVSSIVNRALVAYFEHRARNDALGQMLAGWDREFGPVNDPALEADARAAFDEAEGIIPRRTA